MKRRQKKQFKRNKKEYTRLSDHIGLIPLVMVSPADTLLIAGGSEERRRFMDVVISQFDREYLDALIRYNKALVQRNTLLKAELEPDEELMNVWEEMMASTGEVVFRKRQQFIEEFIPNFPVILFLYIPKPGGGKAFLPVACGRGRFACPAACQPSA